MSHQFYAQLALWSQVLGSAAFLVVVVYLWRRYVTPAVIVAQQRKNEELAANERRRDEAKVRAEEAERLLRSADDDVLAIRARARRDAESERERLLGEATDEGKRLVRNAEGELGRLRRTARASLRDEFVVQALRLAREAASEVDATTNRRLVDEALAVVERGGAN